MGLFIVYDPEINESAIVAFRFLKGLIPTLDPDGRQVIKLAGQGKIWIMGNEKVFPFDL